MKKDYKQLSEEEYCHYSGLTSVQFYENIKKETMQENVPQIISLKIATQDKLINLLYSQVIFLSIMSKIELGDDVIAEIERLDDILEIVEEF